MRNRFRDHISAAAACLCCLVAALSALPASAGPNRWTPIGPDGANVDALVIDPRTPTTAFVGTQGSGILKTVDGGATWATANSGLPTKNVSALAIDPSAPTTLYAGTDAGLFKSSDGAQSWAAASAGLANTYVYTVAVDPTTPTTLYTGTAAGVFKSINGAGTWAPINAGLLGLTSRIIAIDPVSSSVIYVSEEDCDYFDGCSGRVSRSADAGASWAKIYGGFSNYYGSPTIPGMVIDPHSPSRLYLAIFPVGVVRSVDGGATWSHAGPPANDVSSLAIDPANPLTLYVGTVSGSAYRTTDAGDHWTAVTNGLLASGPVNVIALAASAPATVYAAGGGIYRSSDRGETWSRLTLGVRKIGVTALAVDPTTPSTIYTANALVNREYQGGSLVTKTTDGGLHWADTALGVTGQSVNWLAIDPASPSTVYASTYDSPLIKSVDAGAHWAKASNGLRPYYGGPPPLIATSGSTLYIGTNPGGVSKSVDGGSSWTPVNNGLPMFGPAAWDVDPVALAVDPTNADIVYVATWGTIDGIAPVKLSKSTNGAAQWRQVPIDVPTGTFISSLAVDPATPSTIYAAFSDYGRFGIGGVVRSSDRGETWPAAQNLLPSAAWIRALVIDPHLPSRIYVETGDGVFQSTDSAASWTPMNSGLPNFGVNGLSIDRTGTLLRAATPDGLYEYRVSGLPVAATVPVVEYVNSGFGHYFITSSPDEIAKLDNGTFIGWSRTGSEFNVFAAPNANSAPVCRFFSTAFAPKSSHFYTPFAAECATRRADPHWLLESADAFDIAVPAADGSCASGFAPVYRLYNNGQGGAPNHRYTTDVIVRAQMIAQGWMPEGLGVDAVQMCSPP